MKVLLLLFAVFLNISPVIGLYCYHTGSTDPNYRPLFIDALNCDDDKGCYKVIVSSNYSNLKKGVYYGCIGHRYAGYGDPTVNDCSYNSCQSNNGVKTCCCKTDLCNSSRTSSFLTMATLFTAVKMLL